MFPVYYDQEATMNNNPPVGGRISTKNSVYDDPQIYVSAKNDLTQTNTSHSYYDQPLSMSNMPKTDSAEPQINEDFQHILNSNEKYTAILFCSPFMTRRVEHPVERSWFCCRKKEPFRHILGPRWMYEEVIGEHDPELLKNLLKLKKAQQETKETIQQKITTEEIPLFQNPEVNLDTNLDQREISQIVLEPTVTGSEI